MRKEVAEQIARKMASPNSVFSRPPVNHKLPAPAATGKVGKSGAILKIRKHPQWRDIHADIIMELMSARAICEKYNLRTDQGNMPLMAILKHRKRIRDTFPSMFGAGFEEIRREHLQLMAEDGIKRTQQMATEQFEMAKVATDEDGRVVPEFEAMAEGTRLYLAATAKMMEIAKPPAVDPGEQRTQVNTNITLMALPKQEGVPQRALPAPAQHVIEGSRA